MIIVDLVGLWILSLFGFYFLYISLRPETNDLPVLCVQTQLEPGNLAIELAVVWFSLSAVSVLVDLCHRLASLGIRLVEVYFSVSLTTLTVMIKMH